MKVIVVGSGPAGLAAAHAAVGHGCEVVIYSPGNRTPQHGPLLIQRPIPGINTDHPDGTVYQRVIGGNVLDYRYKLYGDVNIGINGDMLAPHYHAWRHRETYDKLWNMYEQLVKPHHVTRDQMVELHQEADLVVSTANAYHMCHFKHPTAGSPYHSFNRKQVSVTPYCSYPNQPDNTILFNADPEVPWVRSSLIFGVPVTEWPVENAPEGALTIVKPINTDCNCYPHILRTGRFGAYKNEVWIDTAYWDTYSALESMKRPELEDIR